MNEFGYRIYCLRKKNHLTQAKLADMIGITFGAVSSWESGRCIPSHDMTEKLPRYLVQHLTVSSVWITMQSLTTACFMFS